METLTLTRAEMLAQWRLRTRLEPLRADASVTRTDGLDLDAIMGTEMDQWYADLLDRGAARLLAPVDLSAQSSATPTGEPGVWSLRLPAGVRRVLRVRLEGWDADARVAEAGTALARRQLSPLTRAGTARPVAVRDDQTLTLCSWPPATPPRVQTLDAVMEPDGQTYTFHPLALATIPVKD